MTVTVKSSDGTTVSVWTEVDSVELMPSHPPLLILIGGAIKKEVIGVQAMGPGMYADYRTLKFM